MRARCGSRCRDPSREPPWRSGHRCLRHVQEKALPGVSRRDSDECELRGQPVDVSRPSLCHRPRAEQRRQRRRPRVRRISGNLVRRRSGLPASLVDPFRGSLTSSANDTYAQQAMIVAAQAGAAKGVKIFDINPGNVDANALATHQMIAQIGNTGVGTFTAQTTSDLQTALGQILTSIVSCDVALSGTVVAGQECQGTVDVDGTPVACDDSNGWKLKDPSTIELVGSAWRRQGHARHAGRQRRLAAARPPSCRCLPPPRRGPPSSSRRTARPCRRRLRRPSIAPRASCRRRSCETD